MDHSKSDWYEEMTRKLQINGKSLRTQQAYFSSTRKELPSIHIRSSSNRKLRYAISDHTERDNQYLEFRSTHLISV